MATRSPELYEYGIQNEQSDIRAHVCPVVRRVYVYPTEAGQRLIAFEDCGYPKVAGFQNGIKEATAMGYLVPPFDIKGCVSLEVRPIAWDHCKFSPDDDTSTKGRKAVRLIVGMIRAGIFPMPYSIGHIDSDPDKTIQIKGDDILVRVAENYVRIQVKCDFRGGDKALGGSGNLYLQVAERNPRKMT